jgi:NitT/TauT family transport system substrate-binding protein
MKPFRKCPGSASSDRDAMEVMAPSNNEEFRSLQAPERSRRKFLRQATLGVAGALLLPRNRLTAAPAPEKVTLRFNWSWVGNYAPVILGRERGFYRDLGIDLIVGQGKGSGATVRQAGVKSDMFVWADTSALLVAGSQGMALQAVMVFARSNLGLVWLEDRTIIRSAQDLKGKRISATPGDGNTQLWPAVPSR